MDKLCEPLEKEYAGTGKILTINDMWGYWTPDIIVGYCFERFYEFIWQPNFRAFFTTAMIDLLETVHFVTQFPSIIHMLNRMPASWIKFLQSGMASVIQFNKVRPWPLS